MKRLNLGAGLTWPSGWVNVDKYPSSENIIEADVLEGLPFSDNYFDFVFMGYVLQVFTYNQHEAVLKEIKRVMKKGATFRVLVADLEKAVDNYRERNTDYFPIADNIEKTMSGKFLRYVYWHGESRSGFTMDSLMDLLRRNSFVSAKMGNFGECELDSREEESLIMEAKK